MNKGKFVAEKTTDYFFFHTDYLEFFVFGIFILLIINTILLFIILKRNKK